MNPAVSNLVIMLVMMQVSKKIPFDDPNVLLGVRVLYVVSNLLIFGLFFYTKSKVQKKNGMFECNFFQASTESFMFMKCLVGVFNNETSGSAIYPISMKIGG
jgi:hypothetical protein